LPLNEAIPPDPPSGHYCVDRRHDERPSCSAERTAFDASHHQSLHEPGIQIKGYVTEITDSVPSSQNRKIGAPYH